MELLLYKNYRSKFPQVTIGSVLVIVVIVIKFDGSIGTRQSVSEFSYQNL